MIRLAFIFLTLATLSHCKRKTEFNWQLAQKHPNFITDGDYGLFYETDPEKIPLNTPFSLRVVALKNKTALPKEAVLTVDARMPQHRHGMTRKPVVTQTGKGKFVVEGMLFHMPGSWELYFDITWDGVTRRLQKSVALE